MSLDYKSKKPIQISGLRIGISRFIVEALIMQITQISFPFIFIGQLAPRSKSCNDEQLSESVGICPFMAWVSRVTFFRTF